MTCNLSPGECVLRLNEPIERDEEMQIINHLLSTGKIQWRHMRIIVPRFLERDGWTRERLITNLFERNEYMNITLQPFAVHEIVSHHPYLLELYKGRYIEPVKLIDEHSNYKHPDYKYSIVRETEFITHSFDATLKYMHDYIQDYCYEKQMQNVMYKYIPAERYNAVVDGNNILLNTCGKVTKRSLSQFVAIVNKLYMDMKSVLIYIHKRHQKVIENYLSNRWESVSDILIIYTPYNYNDDWFSLYYALVHTTYIVSRDNYRDHINRFSTLNNNMELKMFLEYRQIQLCVKFKNLIYPTNTLNMIHKYDDAFYVPYVDGGYVKIEREIN